MASGSIESDQLLQWLSEAATAGASDIHLVSGHHPMLRVHGELKPIDESILAPNKLTPLLESICPAKIYQQFQQDQDADFSMEQTINGELHRIRINYFIAAQSIGACIRLIPNQIPDFQWSGFPRNIAERLAHFRNGLVLMTGITGSGKTTTLAMLVNLLNEEGNHRIITIEEPVEYRYPKRPGSVITQREVGLDVRSFSEGLKYGLRQDPDVILVGEIRDRETARMAMTAAETGHLVFSTLHTRDAKGAISRYTDLFPQNVQTEVRAQLAASLRAVVSQHLLPNAVAGEKRKLALEVMFNTIPIASAIRIGKLPSIDNYILSGRGEGMRTLDDSVKELLYSGEITKETASRFVSDPSSLF